MRIPQDPRCTSCGRRAICPFPDLLTHPVICSKPGEAAVDRKTREAADENEHLEGKGRIPWGLRGMLNPYRPWASISRPTQQHNYIAGVNAGARSSPQNQAVRAKPKVSVGCLAMGWHCPTQIQACIKMAAAYDGFLLTLSLLYPTRNLSCEG